MRVGALFGLICFLSVSVHAADVLVSKAKVEFLAVGKPSAIKIRGKGEKLESKLQVTAKTVTGKFLFDLSTLETGIDTRDQHMKEKYLEVGKFKNAELTLSPFKLAKDICKEDVKLEKTSFEGLLNLHGVEKPVKGEFDVTGAKASGHAQVRFSISITDFGIDIPTYLGIKVADKVENTIELDWSCKE